MKYLIAVYFSVGLAYATPVSAEPAAQTLEVVNGLVLLIPDVATDDITDKIDTCRIAVHRMPVQGHHHNNETVRSDKLTLVPK